MATVAKQELDGALYVEIAKSWEEMYCVLTTKKFVAYRKLRPNLPGSKANKGDQALEFDVLPNECDLKIVKYGLADLSKIMKKSKFAETPCFFSATTPDNQYMLAAGNEEDRANWMGTMKLLAKPKDRKSDAWIPTGFMENGSTPNYKNRFEQSPTKDADLPPSQRKGEQYRTPSPVRGENPLLRKNSSNPSSRQRKDQLSPKFDGTMDSTTDSNNKTLLTNDDNLFVTIDEDDDDEENADCCTKCCQQERFLGVKLDTLMRILKVCTAFPFVIVVASLNLSNSYSFLRSITGIRVMNVIIFVAPFIYVKYVLSEFDYVAIQRIAVAMYTFLYLFPVGYVVFSKVKVSQSTSKIEEGTFCFKPARTVRITQANFYAICGFIFEWILHTLYVLPIGVLTGGDVSRLSDYPPYFKFEVYFWCTVGCTFASGLILVLNACLRGKLHYRFQQSFSIWFFMFNVGSPMFVTFVTILFMSLRCDYSTNPPSLLQDPDIICYSQQHIVMARAGLTALAVYIIQNTLLPSGTFKETMRDKDLDIMFVPVYLQAHLLLKAIFCGIYVYWYDDNYVRVIILTVINMILLSLNNFMKPCSVMVINVIRDLFLVHATLSGIQSVNYLVWPTNNSTKGMLLSTLVSNMVFSSIAMYSYYKYTSKSTEYTIATAFLDLEWQVSRSGSVHPRVLEPLISLTLSSEPEDWEIAKKYIGQLVWLISYPNMRVQFQSAWGLANLALLDEDARLKIHEAGGTKTLFEWYTDMDFLVQLEALAAMANLTLSLEVSEDMVSRYKCIPFFIDLVASSKLKHAQFASIALGNLARKENFREMIRRSGGIQILVSCIMSHDYQKRRHGCRALANLVLSPSKEIEQVFESRGLIDRILKMAMRKEIETQREVIALIRNLACHARLRPLLLDRGVMNAVSISKSSIYPDVVHWCEEITILLEKEISVGSIDLKALIRREGAKGSAIGEADVDLLMRMEPLQGQVEWSTWGSKLEMVFAPVFATVPSLTNVQITVIRDKPITVSLTGGNSKSALRKWRDSMSYVILERPSHGRLNEYTTLKDSITYTPNPDYLGTDFFTYQIQLGGISTAPATVSLSIEEYDENTDYEALNKVQQAAARRKSSLISTGLPSRKGSTYSQPGDDDMDEDFERDIEADVTETNTEKNRRKSSRKYNPSPPPSPNTRSVRYKSIELTDQKDKSNTNSNNRNSKRVSSRATSPPRQQSMRKSVEKSDATENKEESWHSSHEVHTSNSPFVQGLMKKMTSENKKEKDKNVDGDDSRV